MTVTVTQAFAVRITEGVTQTWVFLRLDWAWPANTQYLALV